MEKEKRYQVCWDIWSEDGCCCPCYGLKRGEFRIRFISTDRAFVAQTASLLNRLQAEPEKALDIIEQLLP